MKKTLSNYFNSLETLVNNVNNGSSTYVEPALKNLGTICIPVIREIVAPASFRNADPEITDIMAAGSRRVRAIANKFKYGERSRGLQILRSVNAGGTMAQNKTVLGANAPTSTIFDMNTVVFGDSANRSNQVLPVKACCQYSDALSVAPYVHVVDETFHNRAAEDGTLWDAEKNKNSNNLFTRHFVKPDTLMLQVLTFNGRTAPYEALSHLLMCIGLSGAYGGQTSVYGVNAKSHIVGIYAGKFERPVASPYEALKNVSEDAFTNVSKLIDELDILYSQAYPVRVEKNVIDAETMRYISAIENDEEWVAEEYRYAHGKVGEYFDAWFGGKSSGDN